MDDQLGLSERDKELRKWNAPYRFQAFPKMLYRARTLANGSIEMEPPRIVGSEGEEALALGAGWRLTAPEARAAETRAQEDLGTAAAERAWTDRRLSPQAQAEAAAVDQATAKHHGDIPEKPKRPRRPARPRAE
jgi:hypothetical protein